MAQTRKKRTRKHRGTQAGTIERAARSSSSRPAGGKGRGGARAASGRQPRGTRFDRPPTWRGAATRAALAAALFGGTLVLVLDESPANAAFLAALMLVLYTPMGYFTDGFVYSRRQKRMAQRAAAPAKARPDTTGEAGPPARTGLRRLRRADPVTRVAPQQSAPPARRLRRLGK